MLPRIFPWSRLGAPKANEGWTMEKSHGGGGKLLENQHLNVQGLIDTKS
ncbi:hypothetical protein RU85_GL001139 [Lactococcus garvieae]|nr:hypothetical protein RU85_GL001139 [Lactococcus garvieae]